MSSMDLLSRTIYVFSSALLYPVMILLTLLVFVSLIQLGEFLSEYSKRNRDRSNLEIVCKKIPGQSHPGQPS